MAVRTREGEETLLRMGRLERGLWVAEDEVPYCDCVTSPQPSLPCSLGFCGY